MRITTQRLSQKFSGSSMKLIGHYLIKNAEKSMIWAYYANFSLVDCYLRALIANKHFLFLLRCKIFFNSIYKLCVHRFRDFLLLLFFLYKKDPSCSQFNCVWEKKWTLWKFLNALIKYIATMRVLTRRVLCLLVLQILLAYIYQELGE